MKHHHNLGSSLTVDIEPTSPDHHFVLVINHHEAHLFRAHAHGTVPEKFLPHDPDGYFRHEQNSKSGSRGKERPDANSFFEPIAKALKDVRELLLLGSGTGMSCEMDQFAGWLEKHHPDLFRLIIGKLVVDDHHLTDNQLLEKARKYHAILQSGLAPNS